MKITASGCICGLGHTFQLMGLESGRQRRMELIGGALGCEEGEALSNRIHEASANHHPPPTASTTSRSAGPSQPPHHFWSMVTQNGP